MILALLLLVTQTFTVNAVDTIADKSFVYDVKVCMAYYHNENNSQTRFETHEIETVEEDLRVISIIKGESAHPVVEKLHRDFEILDSLNDTLLTHRLI